MRISDWSSDVCSSDLNALVAAADLALRLNALKSLELKVNPAKIDGGGPKNIVTDQAILRVNMRPATPAAMVAAEATLSSTLDNIERDHDVNCHLTAGFKRPPKPMGPAPARLVGLVRDCGNGLHPAIARHVAGGAGYG